MAGEERSDEITGPQNVSAHCLAGGVGVRTLERFANRAVFGRVLRQQGGLLDERERRQGAR